MYHRYLECAMSHLDYAFMGHGFRWSDTLLCIYGTFLKKWDIFPLLMLWWHYLWWSRWADTAPPTDTGIQHSILLDWHHYYFLRFLLIIIAYDVTGWHCCFAGSIGLLIGHVVPTVPVVVVLWWWWWAFDRATIHRHRHRRHTRCKRAADRWLW